MRQRLEQLTAQGDVEATSALLRHAMRSEDIDGVLRACEAFPVTFVDIDGAALMDVIERGHAPSVRDALRWAVDSLTTPTRESEVHGVLPDGRTITLSGDLEVWPVQYTGLATRIANLARLLPNPQPDDLIGVLEHTYSGETKELRSPDVHPKHSLRLYVDALKVAKGDGWWEWPGWLNGQERIGVEAMGTNWFVAYGETRIYQDGRVECGAIAPPLPRVEVT